MGKRLILHDLQLGDAGILPLPSAEIALFAASHSIRPCVGCFGCWVKTPGSCVIKDRVSALSPLLPLCEEFVILSRVVFGGLSPDVKGCTTNL